jgi:hypothetical protein
MTGWELGPWSEPETDKGAQASALWLTEASSIETNPASFRECECGRADRAGRGL